MLWPALLLIASFMGCALKCLSVSPFLLLQATNIVRQFAALGVSSPDKAVPAAILDGAAGFAILSVAKVRRCPNACSLCIPGIAGEGGGYPQVNSALS